MIESDSYSPLTNSANSRSKKLHERKIELDLPDLTMHGYHVLEELSHRADGKRITYVAKDLHGDRLVVIKQWHTMPGGEAEILENLNAPSLDYADYLPEIERLQQLDHLNIPPYLNSFPTPNGFYVVREYQLGRSLAEIGQLPRSDLKLIADAVLDILEYLQYLHPIVIHQNIKPENIIVNHDRQKLMVYLVDFGLDPDPSSPTIPGTPGFIPPERIFNRKLTSGSDIYSLGVSLICLLTGTPTSQAQNLLNDRYCPQFRHLVPANTPPETIAWLEKMVEPNQQGRYLNAASVDNPIVALHSEQEQSEASTVKSTIVSPTQKIKWWQWGLFATLLLSLGLFLRPLIFPDSDELTPAQIANNQKIAQQAAFEMSDRGKLINEKRCISCNFKYQNFAKADLTGVVMFRSNFNGANLSDANLTLAIFSDADLTGANLTKANLHRAALSGAKLIGTKLVGANLSKANLRYANLKEASLPKANLANANLTAAELSQADLSNANLTNADLTNADLSDANLQGAILTGAKLDGAKLTRTRMPDNSIHK
jgi:uncharacterized protein YjbI with pentapeptide repeats